MEVMSTARQTRLPPLSTCRADGDTPRCAVAVGGWLPDGSDEDVLFAEEALFKRQAWCDEKRARHEVEAAAAEAEDLLRRVERQSADDGAGSEQAVPPSEADALFEQRLPTDELFSSADHPELKMWDVTLLSLDTIANSSAAGNRLAERVSGVADRLHRVRAALARTKMHSVDLCEAINPFIYEMLSLAHSGLPDEGLAPFSRKLKALEDQADAYERQSDASVVSGDVQVSLQCMTDKVATYDECLSVVTAQTDVLSSLRVDVVEPKRARLRNVEQTAVNDIQRLRLKASLAKDRVVGDLQSLNAVMAGLQKDHLAKETAHARWLESSDEELGGIRQRAAEAWDVIAAQYSVLKELAKARLKCIRERVDRNRADARRVARERQETLAFNSRRAVLRLNVQVHRASDECFDICETIVSDLQKRLQEYLSDYDRRLDELAEGVDDTYDEVFKKQYLTLNDILFRKSRNEAALQHAFEDAVATKAELSSKETEELDRVRGLCTELEGRMDVAAREVADLKCRAATSLKVHEQVAGRRLREKHGDSYQSPRRVCDALLENKRVKLAALIHEANDLHAHED
ncbi:hypothetical protein DIPPA_02690 [Diplonema papillatum]|nr:hypothetical protein DIPPA_02690 [Diplonema papillatum]